MRQLQEQAEAKMKEYESKLAQLEEREGERKQFEEELLAKEG